MDDSAILAFFNQLIACVGFFSIVLALGEAVAPNKKTVHYHAIGLYLMVGLALVVDSVNHSRFFPTFSHLAYVNDCLEFFMGAFFFHFFRHLFFPQVPRKGWDQFLFLPGVVNLGFYLPLLLQTGAFKATHYPIALLGDFPLAPYYLVINRTSELWVVFCMVLFLSHFSLWSRENPLPTKAKNKDGQRRWVPYYVSAWVVLLCLFCVNNFFSSAWVQRVIILLCSLLVVFLYFILRRRHELIDRHPESNLPAPAPKSTLQGMDLKAVIDRMNRLVVEERIYRDPELTLAMLGDRLGIKRHQLSEILNRELATSFRSFLNGHRINAAKVLLRSTGEMNILDIAYACGFNSKSAFNSCFLKEVGQTPREYRDGSSPPPVKPREKASAPDVVAPSPGQPSTSSPLLRSGVGSSARKDPRP